MCPAWCSWCFISFSGLLNCSSIKKYVLRSHVCTLGTPTGRVWSRVEGYKRFRLIHHGCRGKISGRKLRYQNHKRNCYRVIWRQFSGLFQDFLFHRIGNYAKLWQDFIRFLVLKTNVEEYCWSEVKRPSIKRWWTSEM